MQFASTSFEAAGSVCIPGGAEVREDLELSGVEGGGGGGSSFVAPEVEKEDEAALLGHGPMSDPAGSAPHVQEHGDATRTQDYIAAATIALARHVVNFSVPPAAQSSRRSSSSQKAGGASTELPGEADLTSMAATALAERLLELQRDTAVVSKALARQPLPSEPRHSGDASQGSKEPSEPPAPPPCSPQAGSWRAEEVEEEAEAEVAASLARHLLTLQEGLPAEASSHMTSLASEEMGTAARALAHHVLNLEGGAA